MRRGLPLRMRLGVFGGIYETAVLAIGRSEYLGGLERACHWAAARLQLQYILHAFWRSDWAVCPLGQRFYEQYGRHLGPLRLAI